MTKWTPAQQNAISCGTSEILVAAAAGSGKTAVLVERIISRLTDPNPQKRIDISNLLVVTFTNAAASEMRSRIGSGIAKKLAETNDPKMRDYLESQLILLSGASISTLHSFCQDIIRQNIHRLGWEPNFRLLSTTESALLKEDTLDRVLEEYYLAGDSDFLALADSHGSNADDKTLRGLILTLHELSLSQPWPKNWLAELSEKFNTPESDYGATPWGQLLLQYAGLILDGSEQTLFGITEEIARRGRSYGNTFANDAETLKSLRQGLAQGWNGFSDALTASTFERAEWGGGKTPPSEKEDLDFFKEQRDILKKQISSLEKFFSRPGNELLADLKKAMPELNLLGQIALNFQEAYQKEKLSKGLADFSDLEHGALEVLRSEKALPTDEQEYLPSEAALGLREKFEEVMIDEYQDTNDVQESIINLICGDNTVRRFQVGDVKQSIYKFRLAEPRLFQKKYDTYQKPTSELILLNQNFRSRNEVLTAINFICSQLFSKDSAELDYGENESLKSGANYPKPSDTTLAGAIELHLLEKPDNDEEDSDDSGSDALQEDNSFRREAHLAAQIMHSWHKEKKQVFDKKTQAYRDFRWRDAVILLRSVKGRTPDLLEILRSYEIPCHAQVDEGYFEETEVRVLLATLAIIDNPRQDIPLATVLRSPIGSLTEEELAQIRLSDTRGSFWEALQEARTSENLPETLRNRLEKFLLSYQNWRKFSRRESVAALIRKILADSLYDSWVTALSGGALRAANLQALQDRAHEFEAAGMRGLSRFMRFIQKIKEKGEDWGPARILGEGEDLVRILSIHRSKGLEFPAVFLLNLGKKFNAQDQRAPIIFHKELGAGPYLTDLDLRYRYPTGPRQAIQTTIGNENKAEELRVLYVALTRAEEKLVLIGSSPNLEKQIKQKAMQAIYSDHVLPPSFVLSCHSYLDWLLLALARHSDMLPLLKEIGAPHRDETLPDTTSWKISLNPPIKDINDHSKKDFPEKENLKNLQPLKVEPLDVENLINWRYTHENEVGKPGKTSVTELKRRLEWLEREDTLPELDALPVPRSPRKFTDRPRFMQEATGLTPAEKGTQLHSLMQHLDFQKAATLEALQEQITGLIQKGLLSEKGTIDLPLAAITSLVKSDLGKRILAGKIARELPFSALIPAKNLLQEWQDIEEAILIQGVVDLLIEEPEGYILLDYKSDFLQEEEAFRTRYHHQLKLYQEALTSILKKPIKEIWLYSFHLEKAILLN